MNLSPAAAQAHVAAQLEEQAAACGAMDSPLYASLLGHAAADVRGGGPCWDVLRGHLLPGRGDALALRFMAAVHRLALSGAAPALHALYAEARACEPCAQRAGAVWVAFAEVVAAHREALARDVLVPCQTNEVGRAAALFFGFAAVAAATRLPLRLLEVGASAGLNLRFDRFRFGGGGGAWGDPASPVDLGGLWGEPPADLGAEIVVASRLGSDPSPIDALSPEGRRALLASVWADQAQRFRRLEGALVLAAQMPAAVVRASADAFAEAELAVPAEGVATVVYHSVVDEYFDAGTRQRFRAALAAAGARASAAAPLAWLRLEPYTSQRHHGVTLTLWPTGGERLVAVCGAHGQDARPRP